MKFLIPNIYTDAVFDPAFFLASPTAILKQNSILAQSGSVIRWDNIEHPPVILSMPSPRRSHLAAASAAAPEKGKRSALEEHGRSQADTILTIALGGADGSQSNSKNSMQSASTPGTAKGSVPTSVTIPKTFDDDVSDAASAAASIHSNANLNAVAVASNELSFIDHSRAGNLNELSMKLHSLGLKSKHDTQSQSLRDSRLNERHTISTDTPTGKIS